MKHVQQPYEATVICASLDGVAPALILAPRIPASNDGLTAAVKAGVIRGRQYLVAAPGGLARLALEHGVRPRAGLTAIFLSSVHPSTAGGLGELLLRLSADGHKAVEVVGVPGAAAYVHSLRHVFRWRHPKVFVREYSPSLEGPLYEDEQLAATYLSPSSPPLPCPQCFLFPFSSDSEALISGSTMSVSQKTMGETDNSSDTSSDSFSSEDSHGKRKRREEEMGGASNAASSGVGVGEKAIFGDSESEREEPEQEDDGKKEDNTCNGRNSSSSSGSLLLWEGKEKKKKKENVEVFSVGENTSPMRFRERVYQESANDSKAMVGQKRDSSQFSKGGGEGGNKIPIVSDEAMFDELDAILTVRSGTPDLKQAVLKKLKLNSKEGVRKETRVASVMKKREEKKIVKKTLRTSGKKIQAGPFSENRTDVHGKDKISKVLNQSHVDSQSDRPGLERSSGAGTSLNYMKKKANFGAKDTFFDALDNVFSKGKLGEGAQLQEVFGLLANGHKESPESSETSESSSGTEEDRTEGTLIRNPSTSQSSEDCSSEPEKLRKLDVSNKTVPLKKVRQNGQHNAQRGHNDTEGFVCSCPWKAKERHKADVFETVNDKFAILWGSRGFERTKVSGERQKRSAFENFIKVLEDDSKVPEVGVGENPVYIRNQDGQVFSAGDYLASVRKCNSLDGYRRNGSLDHRTGSKATSVQNESIAVKEEGVGFLYFFKELKATVLLINCNSVDRIKDVERLTASWQSLGPLQQGENQVLTAVFHLSPFEILQEREYKEWMGKFGRNVRQILVQGGEGELGFLATLKTNAMLNLLSPGNFCLPEVPGQTEDLLLSSGGDVTCDDVSQVKGVVLEGHNNKKNSNIREEKAGEAKTVVVNGKGCERDGTEEESGDNSNLCTGRLLMKVVIERESLPKDGTESVEAENVFPRSGIAEAFSLRKGLACLDVSLCPTVPNVKALQAQIMKENPDWLSDKEKVEVETNTKPIIQNTVDSVIEKQVESHVAFSNSGIQITKESSDQRGIEDDFQNQIRKGVTGCGDCSEVNVDVKDCGMRSIEKLEAGNGRKKNHIPETKENCPLNSHYMTTNASVNMKSAQELRERLRHNKREHKFINSEQQFVENAEELPVGEDDCKGLCKKLKTGTREGIIERLPLEKEPFELIFLGTGSAEPSKHRGSSGILVQFPRLGKNILLDVGGGVLGQLKRRLGKTGACEAVKNMEGVWVSHRHADHAAGLVELIMERDVTQAALLVIGPMVVSKWLQEVFDSFSQSGLTCPSYAFIHCGLLEEQRPLASGGKGGGSGWTGSMPVLSRLSHRDRWRYERLLRALDLESVQAVRVIHCFDSWGLVLKCSGGLSIVYSGDTRPCPALVERGRGCTLLIHECTYMDQVHINLAVTNRHSTWKEALAVGEAMGAKTILLTHFSQRHRNVDLLSTPSLNACVAFDGMLVKASELPSLSSLLPRLAKAFKSEENGFEPGSSLPYLDSKIGSGEKVRSSVYVEEEAISMPIESIEKNVGVVGLEVGTNVGNNIVVGGPEGEERCGSFCIEESCSSPTSSSNEDVERREEAHGVEYKHQLERTHRQLPTLKAVDVEKIRIDGKEKHGRTVGKHIRFADSDNDGSSEEIEPKKMKKKSRHVTF